MRADDYDDTEFGRAKRTLGSHSYSYIAYYPRRLPRRLATSDQHLMLVADAEAALGRLVGIGRLLPDPQLLVRPYLSREAVASTRIEGTQASLDGFFDAEADDRPLSADFEEVRNYMRAMELAVERLPELPLSVRLIKEVHSVLLAGVRGQERQPGELRKSQNWIGAPCDTPDTALFVPPPPQEVADLLSDLEKFIHEPPRLPPLVQAAMLHYQCETIHPFLDGNGRLGRLLSILFLVHSGRLPIPLLYLSPYFEVRRDEYYALLQRVRTKGDFGSWLEFFLRAVCDQSEDATARAERLTDLRERYRQAVQASTRGIANALVDVAFRHPVLNTRLVLSRLEVSLPSALRALRQLEQLGMLDEAPAGPRGQLRWRATEVLSVLR